MSPRHPIWSLFLGLLLALGSTWAAPNARASSLVLSGSTTCQKRLIEPSADAMASETGIEVTVRGINSGKGLEELSKGVVPASLASSPLALLLQKAGLPDDGTYQEHTIIRDVIVPIVHPDNPVRSLTWDQLSGINTGKIANWSEVGGADQQIVVVTSQPTAATRVVFQKLVMAKQPYAEGAREVTSTRQEVDLVGQFRGGIGAVSESFVRLNPGKVAIIQTDAIARPLSVITKGDPTPEVQQVIDYLRSPEAGALFR